MRERVEDPSIAVNHSDELQHKDQTFLRRQYSYDLTQQLTFYIVSAQLVTCGYILLNFDSLSNVRNLSYIFLLSGISAFSGILWRYCYNITYYNRAHGINGKVHTFTQVFQKILYYLYVLVTIVSFVLLLISGFCYLNN